MGYAARGGEAVFFDEPDYRVQIRPVQKVGRLGRDEYLPAEPRVHPKFIRKLVQDVRVEMILRLLHRQHRMGLRVLQQHEVGEHFDCAVGYAVGGESVLKSAVSELQD